jgi:signal transduction histidine kinase/DNA-binding response OmpR family regulator
MFDRRSQRFVVFKNDPMDRNSLSNNKVQCLHQSSGGILWVGTASGLNRFDHAQNTFVCYRVIDGLDSDDIQNIAEDRHGNLWLRTARGIARFDPAHRRFKNYDMSDFSGGALEITRSSSREGVLFLPLGTDGLVAFHPDSIRDNNNTPPIVFTDFRVGSRSVSHRTPNSVLKQAIWTAKEVSLTHRDNIVAIDFAVLEYTNPAKHKYAYRMDGFDNDWIYSDTKRTATYTNLDPGTYTFRVKATNSDGIWNEKGTSVTIFISPPWWKTTWAYAGYLTAVLGAFFSIRRFERNKELLKHQLALEQVKSEKLAEIDQVKSRFFANISHEFRTPLTLIEGPVKHLRSGEYKGDPNDQYDLILRNSRRLLRLVNQLLDLSKIESEEMELHVREADIVDAVRGIAAGFESEAKLKNIGYTLNYPAATIVGWFDSDALEKIVTNLLSNAFKFTPEAGQVSVTVRIAHSPPLPLSASGQEAPRGGEWKSGGEFVAIAIADTGIGIPEAEAPRIFDRFYQVDDSHTRGHEGAGIGLALTKELVGLHRGTIDVQSVPGRGSTFTVRLPLGKEHFKPENIVDHGSPAHAETPFTAVESPQAAEREAFDSIEETARDSKPLVLIVEDNADLRSFIRVHLDHEYRIQEANDGAEGVEQAIAMVPDIVVSDVMMPNMDGFQVCAKLKSDERTSHIPVILLTAKASHENRIEGLETGADDYMTKPFDARELQVRVRNLIEQRKKLREKFRGEGMFNPKEITITSVDDRFLNRAREIVEAHISNQAFTTELFAQEMYLSRMQCHRKIRALTDLSPWQFVRKIRLHRAADLIRKRAGNIAEIASMTGYESPSRFAEAFRHEFGQTPSEFDDS